jgi:hypothetical protein
MRTIMGEYCTDGECMMDTENYSWPVEMLTVYEATTEYPRLWNTVKRMMPAISDEYVARVVSIVLDTCHHCYEAPGNCKCWNDE